MRLKQWMKLSRVTQSEFARRTGIDQSLLCKYLKKKRRPSADNIRAIRDETKGAVDLDDWAAKRSAS